MRTCVSPIALIFLAVTVLSPATLFSGDQSGRSSRTPDWRIPENAPLLTRWGRALNPAKVHPEYPRPQFVRKEWLSLNGLWQYVEADPEQVPPIGKELTGRILVPFPVGSALSGVMNDAVRLWYRRSFTVPKSWGGKRVILQFGAVDWEATVFVNGKFIGMHRGGYDPFSFDVTAALTPEKDQELIVGVYDPSDGGDQPRGKQVTKPGGIWYTPTTGIWQTVWLEPVPVVHLADLMITPDPSLSAVHVQGRAAGSTGSETIRATISADGTTVGTVTGEPGMDLVVSFRHVRVWTPDDPFLYDVQVELLREGGEIDRVGSYFGMRSVSVGKDDAGITRIRLNGEFVMQIGTLDQGFWPDGLYTAPSDEALKYDIIMTKKLGFNMIRKHVKVEPERWYYWADRLGVFVWQDMPSGNNVTKDDRVQFEAELARMVASRRNHPSIIMWVVFNEGWGQYDTERLTAWVKTLDPSRLVNNASGWDDKRAGHVVDVHSYPKPRAPKAEETRARVLGEFGGLGLAIPEHTWKKEHWGYRGMADQKQLTATYESLMRSVYQLRADSGLSAAVYTQITDVEVECNGLLTYDRVVVKPDTRRIAAVNQGDFSRVPPPPTLRVIFPTSEATGQEWRYTNAQPAADWFTPAFDASSWKTGPGGFGTEGTPGAIVRTVWNTPDIWLQREISVTDKTLRSPHVRIHHDEEATLYINGVLAGSFDGFTSDYEEVPLTAEGAGALKPGRNILALHCRQTKGGQFIDAGIVDVIPAGAKSRK